MGWLWVVDLVARVAHAIIEALSKQNGGADQAKEVQKAASRVLDPDEPASTVTEQVTPPQPRPPG